MSNLAGEYAQKAYPAGGTCIFVLKAGSPMPEKLKGKREGENVNV